MKLMVLENVGNSVWKSASQAGPNLQSAKKQVKFGPAALENHWPQALVSADAGPVRNELAALTPLVPERVASSPLAGHLQLLPSVSHGSPRRAFCLRGQVRSWVLCSFWCAANGVVPFIALSLLSFLKGCFPWMQNSRLTTLSPGS